MKKAALSALAILCAWDILRPRESRSSAWEARTALDENLRQIRKYNDLIAAGELRRILDILQLVSERAAGCPNMTSTSAYGCNGAHLESCCSMCLLHSAMVSLQPLANLDSSGLTSAPVEYLMPGRRWNT